MYPVTIIVQGPLNRTSIQACETYKKYGPVIYSHWSEDNLKLKEGVDATFVDNGSFQKNIVSPYNNRSLQWKSTLGGLMHVKTDWAIKVRSDSVFPELDCLLEKLVDDKVVTCNIFAKHWQFYPFHISDYLILGTTETMKAGFAGLVHDLTLPKQPIVASVDLSQVPAEVALANYLMKARDPGFYFKPEWKGSRESDYRFRGNPATLVGTLEDREFMRKYFDIASVDDMGEYEAPCSALNCVFSPSNPYNEDKGEFHFHGRTMEDLLCS